MNSHPTPQMGCAGAIDSRAMHLVIAINVDALTGDPQAEAGRDAIGGIFAGHAEAITADHLTRRGMPAGNQLTTQET